MDIEQLAHEWVNDGPSGHPQDQAGEWMFKKLVEAFKAGYEAHTQQKLNIASVVRPEVESAKEGELLPESDGEANTCADWKVKCHKCGKVFEKVTDLWGHLNSPCA